MWCGFRFEGSRYRAKPIQRWQALWLTLLLARRIGHPFSRSERRLTYFRSSDLPLEIARSIYAAREYHVLWTHDFTGRTETGAVDNIGYSLVADAYFPALTAAVKRYDRTGCCLRT